MGTARSSSNGLLYKLMFQLSAPGKEYWAIIVDVARSSYTNDSSSTIAGRFSEQVNRKKILDYYRRVESSLASPPFCVEDHAPIRVILRRSDG